MSMIAHSPELCKWHSHCDYAGCTESHRKFATCITEAIWSATLDGGGESTGSTDAYGHFVAVTFEAPEDVHLFGHRNITVPAGHYIIESDSQGFVGVSTYETEDLMFAAFAAEAKAYGEWLDSNEPD